MRLRQTLAAAMVAATALAGHAARADEGAAAAEEPALVIDAIPEKADLARCNAGEEPDAAAYGLDPEEELLLCSLRVLDGDKAVHEDVFSCACPEDQVCLTQERAAPASNESKSDFAIEYGACVSAPESYCSAVMWPELSFWQNFRLGGKTLGPILSELASPLCHLGYTATQPGADGLHAVEVASCICPSNYVCGRGTFVTMLDMGSDADEDRRREYYLTIGHCTQPNRAMEGWLILMLPFAFAASMAFFAYAIKALWDGANLSNVELPAICASCPLRLFGTRRRVGAGNDQGFELLSEACRGSGSRGSASEPRTFERTLPRESDGARAGARSERRADKPIDGFYDEIGGYSSDDGVFDDDGSRRFGRRRDRFAPNQQPDLEVPLTVHYGEMDEDETSLVPM